MGHDQELKKYAAAFAYFLLKGLEPDRMERINSIILFGSVAQGRANPSSDIDIFIDAKPAKSRMRQLRTAVAKIREEFLLSAEALGYKARGLSNEINVIIGDLSGWPEMKRSVTAGGIVLFGSYTGKFSRADLKAHTLFYWQGGGKGRGAFLNKVYGYLSNGKRYSGAIERLGGMKIGKSAALIPAENGPALVKTLQFYKIGYRTLDVFK